MADPFPKSKQLARGERRYRRKVASPKQWQAIIAAKGGPCRVCSDPASNGRVHGLIEFHHLVSRARGGDDVAENIVPLCHDCHDAVTRGAELTTIWLADRLTPEEIAYVESKRRAVT
jgi:5-methylcytosine-specific restriction endonuclease McrA